MLHLTTIMLVSYEYSGQSLKVTEIIVHQNFTEINYANDIAIIKLSAEAQLNNYVQTACLWSSTRTDISEIYGKSGTVIGWRLTEKDEKSNVLREAALPVVLWDTCLETYADAFRPHLSRRNYCAGSRNGTIVCQGDSGGAITFEDEENGPSPSKPNRNIQEMVCDPSQYAVFTDVAQYLR